MAHSVTSTARTILTLDAYDESLDWEHIQRMASYVVREGVVRTPLPPKNSTMCKLRYCYRPRGKKQKIGQWNKRYAQCDFHREYMRERQQEKWQRAREKR